MQNGNNARVKESYIMKKVGAPQYYLGGNILELNEDWQQEGITQAFAATIHIKNYVPKIIKMVGLENLPRKNTLMNLEYHPGRDESELCNFKKTFQRTVQ